MLSALLAPSSCQEADSYSVYDVDVAVYCRQVVGEDGSVSNANALERNNRSFHWKLRSTNISGIIVIFLSSSDMQIVCN